MLQQLLEYIENSSKKFIVVGGAQIYDAFISYVDTMYLTEINEVSPADTFFPKIDIHDWTIETIFEHNDIDYLDDNYISYVRNRYSRRRLR